jgi:hypothetical protein
MWKPTLGYGNIIHMLDTFVVIFVLKSIVMYTKLYHICSIYMHPLNMDYRLWRYDLPMQTTFVLSKSYSNQALMFATAQTYTF